jgi:hypothetical protein
MSQIDPAVAFYLLVFKPSNQKRTPLFIIIQQLSDGASPVRATSISG